MVKALQGGRNASATYSHQARRVLPVARRDGLHQPLRKLAAHYLRARASRAGRGSGAEAWRASEAQGRGVGRLVERCGVELDGARAAGERKAHIRIQLQPGGRV